MVKILRNPATTQEEFPGDETVARNTQAVPGDTLIEEQFHFKVAVKLVLASSIAAIASALVTLGKSSRNSDSVRPCSR